MQIRRVPVLFLYCLLPLLCLHACGGNVQAPVEAPGEQVQNTIPAPATKPEPGPASRRLPAYHVVNKGDTLYSIAWNYGYDYRDVAAWNSINPPYIIYPGQRIHLSGQPGIVSSPDAQPARTPDTALTPGPIIIKRKPGAESAPTEPAPPAVPPQIAQHSPPVAESITWLWPAQGSIIRAETPIAKNGIDIAGKRGQQINASAPGEVVYSGSGLLGYGRLIIIKHNDVFLSAYAHNSELLVKEGDRVRGGQNIALMGETANGKALLHFEIRKNGQPVDPLKHLPNIK